MLDDRIETDANAGPRGQGERRVEDAQPGLAGEWRGARGAMRGRGDASPAARGAKNGAGGRSNVPLEAWAGLVPAIFFADRHPLPSTTSPGP